MPIRSMTGFGQGESTLDGRRLRIELRAVNHRYLDVRVRMPTELASQAPTAEALLRARLGRGRVELNARLDVDGGASALSLDVERARAAIAALVALRDELAPDEPVPLGLLASVPDLFAPPPSLDREAAERAVTESVRAACDDLDAMRVREGTALARDFAARIATLVAHLDAIDEGSRGLVAAQRTRLRDRVEELLGDSGASLEPGRLEQEIAILADRSDVTEELTRLRSHLTQFTALAAAEESAGALAQVGRKLDFLVQEMNREVNTIGSKCADAAIAHVVVEMKAEIERIREQVQNVV